MIFTQRVGGVRNSLPKVMVATETVNTSKHYVDVTVICRPRDQMLECQVTLY